MEEMIAKTIEIVVISTYLNIDIFTQKVLYWNIILVVLNLSIPLMKTKPDDPEASKKSKACFALFCLYLFCGILYSFFVFHYIFFNLNFLIVSGLLILRYSPPFTYEKKGSGGIFRIMLEGVFWVTLHTFALSDDFKVVIIEYMPIFLVYEAWYLTKELQEAADDIKNKVVTTVILIGKNGLQKIFVLIHSFCFIFVVLDSYVEPGKCLPIILVPWALYQIKYIRFIDNKSLQLHSFLYFVAFGLLTALGTKLDNYFNYSGIL